MKSFQLFFRSATSSEAKLRSIQGSKCFICVEGRGVNGLELLNSAGALVPNANSPVAAGSIIWTGYIDRVRLQEDSAYWLCSKCPFLTISCHKSSLASFIDYRQVPRRDYTQSLKWLCCCYTIHGPISCCCRGAHWVKIQGLLGNATSRQKADSNNKRFATTDLTRFFP